ncbi:hypothetical protein CEXT_168531 [Caerostris extrusa]|uniref:Uncharacterized protein n=1 Tax=Caerostris extrusa TaxID=172846 RepID=A0AAV4PAI5_CAEEX|nr:hypothetical protein CEXT_168531 [Caerostris extrusa]
MSLTQVKGRRLDSSFQSKHEDVSPSEKAMHRSISQSWGSDSSGFNWYCPTPKTLRNPKMKRHRNGLIIYAIYPMKIKHSPKVSLPASHPMIQEIRKSNI